MKTPLSILARIGLLLLACLAISACGKSGPALGELAPVSGKVTVDGNPVTSGNVSLIPIDKSTESGGGFSAGEIDSSGGYVIHTAGKKGAPIGRYKATISASMIPTGDNKMPVTPFNMKYTNQSKTPLIVNVEANPAAGAYDLKLTK